VRSRRSRRRRRRRILQQDDDHNVADASALVIEHTELDGCSKRRPGRDHTDAGDPSKQIRAL